MTLLILIKMIMKKIIVIDSAEKLLDIIDNTPIIEFLSAIIKSNWKIIFTTRNSYLEDLQGVLLDTLEFLFIQYT